MTTSLLSGQHFEDHNDGLLDAWFSRFDKPDRTKMSLVDVLAEFKEKEGVSDILRANWYTVAVRHTINVSLLM